MELICKIVSREGRYYDRWSSTSEYERGLGSSTARREGIQFSVAINFSEDNSHIAQDFMFIVKDYVREANAAKTFEADELKKRIDLLCMPATSSYTN